jgi:hypothetical protein
MEYGQLLGDLGRITVPKSNFLVAAAWVKSFHLAISISYDGPETSQ